MKPVWVFLWVKEVRPLKEIPLDAEADMPLTRLSISPQNLSGLLLESQRHHVFFRQNTLLGYI
jgi:hypothetical protein